MFKCKETKTIEYWISKEHDREQAMQTNGKERMARLLNDTTPNGIAFNAIYNSLLDCALVYIKQNGLPIFYNHTKFATIVAYKIATSLMSTPSNTETLQNIVTNEHADNDTSMGVVEMLGLTDPQLWDMIHNTSLHQSMITYVQNEDGSTNRCMTDEEQQAIIKSTQVELLQRSVMAYHTAVYNFIKNLIFTCQYHMIENTSNLMILNGNFQSITDTNIRGLEVMVDALSKVKSIKYTDAEIDSICKVYTYGLQLLESACKYSQYFINGCCPHTAERKTSTLITVSAITSIKTNMQQCLDNTIAYNINPPTCGKDEVIQFITKCVVNIVTPENEKHTQNQTPYVMKPSKGNTIELTDYCKQKFAINVSEFNIVYEPIMTAMCCPPLDWTRGRDEGGYLDIRKPLVPRLKPEYDAPETDYLEGINIAQKTPFTINDELVDYANTIGYIYSHQCKCNKFKTHNITPVYKNNGARDYKKNKPYGWTETRWKRYITSMESKNVQLANVMGLAQEYQQYDEIYFPMYADNRGRGYYRPLYLSPQTSDLGKAVLMFNRCRDYLYSKDAKKYAIAFTGLYGVDKISIFERVRWFKRNEDKILNMVDWLRYVNEIDQHSTDDQKRINDAVAFFDKADNPWQVLAMAIDYKSFKRAIAVDGRYLSFLYAGKDGRCNGTQHWTTILRDEDGAKQVGICSVSSKTTPIDVYSEVGKNLLMLLKNDASRNEFMTMIKSKLGNINFKRPYEDKTISKNFAQLWLKAIAPNDAIDRKLVKRPTMTSTYSAGQRAFKNFVRLYMVDNGIEFKLKAIPSELMKSLGIKNGNTTTTKTTEANQSELLIAVKCIKYISQYIQTAIDMTMKIRTGMEFVQKLAVTYTSKEENKNKPIHWKTRIGFHVYLDDKAMRKQIVRFYDGNSKRLVTMTVQRPKKDQLDIRKFATAIAPDYIHSNDATHMFMTVIAAKDSIKQWALVHDDYATSLCDWDHLDNYIRTEFVELYKATQSNGMYYGVLEDMRDQMNISSLDVPSPKYGTLDINIVKDSLYFFI